MSASSCCVRQVNSGCCSLPELCSSCSLHYSFLQLLSPLHDHGQQQWPHIRGVPWFELFPLCKGEWQAWQQQQWLCPLPSDSIPVEREGGRTYWRVIAIAKLQIWLLISKCKPASTSLPKNSVHLSVFPNDHSHFYLFLLLM